MNRLHFIDLKKFLMGNSWQEGLVVIVAIAIAIYIGLSCRPKPKPDPDIHLS